ncbi:hypothetical protein EDB94_0342 [Marinobacter sp. 3-2]|jgi:hypothetical protein|uniref:hypothetical protein n=1 Tax=Marinobacter sp. 3-2 TaxID=2485141 RepID=UPI000D36E296|nr:hypothetical protein [Marinobacter sp. 3-2]ROQ48445.1 hypothetical protein EDB94_0342 [Marinobacter sp. 3-2]
MRPHITQSQIAIVASLTALLISAAGFYNQWWREEASLTMRMLDFDFQNMPNSEATCTLEAAVFNTGNRDSAILSIQLLHSKETVDNAGIRRGGSIYWSVIDDNGGTLGVFSPGTITLVNILFPGCTVESIYNNVVKKGEEMFELGISSINHRGSTATVYVNFADTRLVDDKVDLEFHFEGLFSMFQHGAHLYGKSDSARTTLSLIRAGDGENDFSLERTKSFSYPGTW